MSKEAVLFRAIGANKVKKVKKLLSSSYPHFRFFRRASWLRITALFMLGKEITVEIMQ